MVDIKTELPSYPDNFIRGEVVLGTRDPRILTEEEFRSSSELLYHGAAKDFIYSPSGEFDPDNTGSDSWHDYGAGFYTTDNLNQASNYSLERTSQGSSLPRSTIVYSFLPYQARMLDVRSIGDPLKNGILPKEFVKEWLNYLDSFLSNEDNFSKYNGFLKDVYQNGTREDFFERVKKVLQSSQDTYIRSGLRGAGIFKNTGNGFISPIFRDFMLSKGYDGMIYREGGEGKAGENLTGYVFYNPRIVDTWEGWQKRAI